MKEKILPFIIGLLVGAIIATGGFLIYQKNNKHQGPGRMNGERPQMMQRQNGSSTDGNSTDGNTPPALPNGEQPNGEAPSGEASAQNGQTQNSSNATSTTSNS